MEKVKSDFCCVYNAIMIDLGLIAIQVKFRESHREEILQGRSNNLAKK